MLEIGSMRRTMTFTREVPLPDFRNYGVILRCLVLAELGAAVARVSSAPDGLAVLLRADDGGLLFEATVLCVILALFVVSPLLRRLPYLLGVGVVLGIVAAIAGSLDVGARAWFGEAVTGGALKAVTLSGVLAVTMLAYFRWRSLALFPAITDARLAALESRIRPHSLFNSLNTALSLVRVDPRLAEQVLLNMADLFRVLLSENKGLVSLEDEIQIAKAYLEIEQLRLGERLSVHWKYAGAPLTTSVPVLLLQPLIEHIVCWDIEPASRGGEIYIRIGTRAEGVEIEVQSRLFGDNVTAAVGPGVVVGNIRERLAVHFDAEADVVCLSAEGGFIVKIRVPTGCYMNDPVLQPWSSSVGARSSYVENVTVV